MLFSVWIAFALTVINPYLASSVPGYVVGRPCIWELIVGLICLVIAYFLTKKNPVTRVKNKDGRAGLIIPDWFIYFFLYWFVIAWMVFGWQFYLFMQQF